MVSPNKSQINFKKDANDIAIFFNIYAGFASNLDARLLEIIAKSVFSFNGRVILVSGPITGVSPKAETIERVKSC